jgi:uncharacterized protein (TIGR02391 family)
MTRQTATTVPPTIDVARAIALLSRQLERADEIEQLPHNDPRVIAWENTTGNILDKAYGMPNGERHRNSSDFMNARGGPLHVNMSDGELQASHIIKLRTRSALLEAIIEQLRDLAPPAAVVHPQEYSFHPEIQRVSGQLLRDGHFKHAALEAYICVINAVREKVRLDLDGDDLMNQTFGSDRRIPRLRFNELGSDAERDEQRGLMYLYKGIVGLRNSKAHSNTLFADPARAYEYLALASLLLRLLDLATPVPA